MENTNREMDLTKSSETKHLYLGDSSGSLLPTRDRSPSVTSDVNCRSQRKCYTFELFQMKAFANNIGLYSQSFDLLQIQQYSTKTKTELGKSKQLKHLQ